MLAVAALLLATLAADDPRPRLMELQLADRHREALEVTDQQLAEKPDEAQKLGLFYLRAHLLGHLGREHEATAAFAQLLAGDHHLARYGRYRLALDQARYGHPEVAAGLVSTIVADNSAPSALRSQAVELLTRAIDAGGDCLHLKHLGKVLLPARERRLLRLSVANCTLQDGDAQRAMNLYRGLVAEGVQDEVERRAAELLHQRFSHLQAPQVTPVPGIAEILGLAFHQHGDFDRAVLYLRRALSTAGSRPSDNQLDTAYALARSRFRQERFLEAAERFGWITRNSTDHRRRARAFYQQGRSYELVSQWRQAADSFRAAVRSDPDSSIAGAALVSLLRLRWLAGAEEEAEALLSRLLERQGWRDHGARAALFLASSDLVRGRHDRADSWLDIAERETSARTEVEYWRGRQAELAGDIAGAIEHYVAVQRRDLYHPLAVGGRKRLAQPHLAPGAAGRGRHLAASEDPDALYDALILLGPEHEDSDVLLERLRRRLASDRRTAAFVGLQRVPLGRWPLWEKDLRQPEELLLSLGIWSQGAPAVGDHFPAGDADLAFTGSELLATVGETHRSLLRAEILEDRIPSQVPELLLPSAYRRLLYPRGHRSLLESQGRRFRVDPLLLAAIIREESRFDERALSSASARGLTQFMRTTAEQVGGRHRIRFDGPEDLYDPGVAIELGAAYLSELHRTFRGAAELAVAAYNAGEPQAQLWRSYCFSAEPEEYFSKVGFEQTRNYVRKVLSSWQRYRLLYGEESDGTGASRVSTTGGNSPG